MLAADLPNSVVVNQQKTSSCCDYVGANQIIPCASARMRFIGKKTDDFTQEQIGCGGHGDVALSCENDDLAVRKYRFEFSRGRCKFDGAVFANEQESWNFEVAEANRVKLIRTA